VNAFVGKPFVFAQFLQAIREAAAGVPYLIRTNQLSGDRVSVDLALGPEVNVVKGVIGGVVGGGGIQTPFGPIADQRTNTAVTESNGPPFPDDSVPFVPNLQPVSTVDPAYPPLARQARIQGVVVMRVVINTEGKIENIRIVTGHPLLIQAAIDAVKKWVYPTQSSQVATNVTLNFAFQQ
jgi:protein TonB